MPMLLITGQKGIKTSRQARFQIVDIVATMKPWTKRAPDREPRHHPEPVREAFRIAMEERL